MKKKSVKFTKEKIAKAIIAGLTIIALTSGNFLITGKEVIAFARGYEIEFSNRRYIK